jgi:hypothetical protein
MCCSVRVYYGSVASDWFGGVDGSHIPTHSISLDEDEVITNITVYLDKENRYVTIAKVIAGIKITTSTGAVHGPYGPTTTYKHTFNGTELLYLYGHMGHLIDFFGAVFVVEVVSN